MFGLLLTVAAINFYVAAADFFSESLSFSNFAGWYTCDYATSIYRYRGSTCTISRSGSCFLMNSYGSRSNCTQSADSKYYNLSPNAYYVRVSSTLDFSCTQPASPSSDLYVADGKCHQNTIGSFQASYNSANKTLSIKQYCKGSDCNDCSNTVILTISNNSTSCHLLSKYEVQTGAYWMETGSERGSFTQFEPEVDPKYVPESSSESSVTIVGLTVSIFIAIIVVIILAVIGIIVGIVCCVVKTNQRNRQRGQFMVYSVPHSASSVQMMNQKMQEPPIKMQEPPAYTTSI